MNTMRNLGFDCRLYIAAIPNPLPVIAKSGSQPIFVFKKFNYFKQFNFLIYVKYFLIYSYVLKII